MRCHNLNDWHCGRDERGASARAAGPADTSPLLAHRPHARASSHRLVSNRATPTGAAHKMPPTFLRWGAIARQMARGGHAVVPLMGREKQSSQLLLLLVTLSIAYLVPQTGLEPVTPVITNDVAEDVENVPCHDCPFTSVCRQTRPRCAAPRLALLPAPNLEW